MTYFGELRKELLNIRHINIINYLESCHRYYKNRVKKLKMENRALKAKIKRLKDEQTAA